MNDGIGVVLIVIIVVLSLIFDSKLNLINQNVEKVKLSMIQNTPSIATTKDNDDWVNQIVQNSRENQEEYMKRRVALENRLTIIEREISELKINQGDR